MQLCNVRVLDCIILSEDRRRNYTPLWQMWLKIERGLRYEGLGKVGDCGCFMSTDGSHNM